MTENKSSRIVKPHYETEKGALYLGPSENLLRSPALRDFKGEVQLLLTSPPFPLNRKKKYGNLVGAEYTKWLCSFASLFAEYLTPDGSIVIELGNAWNPGLPTISTLSIETLLQFKLAGEFYLCQEFIYYNPARLPTPVQWVNRERIRVKDSFSRFWWLSPTPRPYANNRHVLVEYSSKMKKLLQSGAYNAGTRPSEHRIGETSFLTDNGGAIPSNVIVATNTNSSDSYLSFCREKNLEAHPARMPEEVVSFFVKFLTRANDLVLDPFAGSNTTGAAAEALNRRWLSVEVNEAYAASSIGRFDLCRSESNASASI